MAISDERREVLRSVARRFAGDFGVEPKGNLRSYASLLYIGIRNLIEDAVECYLERETEGQTIRLVEEFDGGGLRAVRGDA